jgi:chromate reductase, NAD(P)H dehydrogenase (quinone)
MDKPMNVCVLVGSLRKASLNKILANALMSLAPSSMKLEIVEIGQLPLFNQDLETGLYTRAMDRVPAARQGR